MSEVKPATDEQQKARFDLARVVAEIDIQIGTTDHRRNLAECYLLLLKAAESDRAIIAELMKALEEVIRCEAQWPIEQMYDLDKELDLKAAIAAGKTAIAKARAEGK